tara:strand:+ start:118 stop:549 length:432 start_codon:yes stop_codon:yes gene_type:complete
MAYTINPTWAALEDDDLAAALLAAQAETQQRANDAEAIVSQAEVAAYIDDVDRLNTLGAGKLNAQAFKDELDGAWVQLEINYAAFSVELKALAYGALRQIIDTHGGAWVESYGGVTVTPGIRVRQSKTKALSHLAELHALLSL